MKLSNSLHPLLTDPLIYILQQFHITSLSQLLAKEPEQVASITKLSYSSVLQLRRDLFLEHAAFPSCSYGLYQSWLDCPALSTGCGALDGMLGGGLMPGTVYEVFGEEGVGRTQLGLTLAAAAVENTDRAVVYLDTKNDLCPQRLLEILEQRKVNSGQNDSICSRSSQSELSACLGRVMVAKVYKAKDLGPALREVDSKMSSGQNGPWSKVKLLILDNLAAPLLPYVGGPNLQDGFSVGCEVGQLLHQLATTRNIAVVAINNARRRQAQVLPSLGKMWAGLADVRIFMEKVEGGARKLSVVMGEGDRHSCLVNLSSRGIGKL